MDKDGVDKTVDEIALEVTTDEDSNVEDEEIVCEDNEEEKEEKIGWVDDSVNKDEENNTEDPKEDNVDETEDVDDKAVEKEELSVKGQYVTTVIELPLVTSTVVVKYNCTDFEAAETGV